MDTTYSGHAIGHYCNVPLPPPWRLCDTRRVFICLFLSRITQKKYRRIWL